MSYDSKARRAQLTDKQYSPTAPKWEKLGRSIADDQV